MKQTLSISIVIPVYNEAAHLPACLDAIAAQTVKPKEVIVVDNNSTDDTVKIARSYAFVKVIREKRQGVVYARDTGFNRARGDIIGRIDADTVLSHDWVQIVAATFREKSVAAISGCATYHDMALTPLLNAIDFRLRSYLAAALKDDVALQGANMAIRRSAWAHVRSKVCHAPGMHEDLDLSVHLNLAGLKVRFVPEMKASLGYRQVSSSYAKFTQYIMLSPRTYALHGLTSQRHMYPLCALAIVSYWPLRILHLGFDKESERFSFARLFSETEQRVNPATYVD